jgi:predicted  nucleic acid-binding Zn-ribbon protein
VAREYTSSQDVTETFIDNEARLKNLYALRDRIRALLEKADEVEELLKIERELSRIQSEIDSLEGRQKSLQQSVDFAEVSVTFEPRTILGPLGYVASGVGWVVEKLFFIRR